MLNRKNTKTVVAGCLVIAAAALSGCSYGGPASYSKAAEYQSNPSPELMTLRERSIDVDNRMAVTANENLRMMSEDLGRVFLLDRQSRLSPAPVPR
jgi:hypothetical protein